eukprot:ANDGO_03726.mRNA.1 hypothetical protein
MKTPFLYALTVLVLAGFVGNSYATDLTFCNLFPCTDTLVLRITIGLDTVTTPIAAFKECARVTNLTASVPFVALDMHYPTNDSDPEILASRILTTGLLEEAARNLFLAVPDEANIAGGFAIAEPGLGSDIPSDAVRLLFGNYKIGPTVVSVLVNSQPLDGVADSLFFGTSSGVDDLDLGAGQDNVTFVSQTNNQPIASGRIKQPGVNRGIINGAVIFSAVVGCEGAACDIPVSFFNYSSYIVPFNTTSDADTAFIGITAAGFALAILGFVIN